LTTAAWATIGVLQPCQHFRERCRPPAPGPGHCRYVGQQVVETLKPALPGMVRIQLRGRVAVVSGGGSGRQPITGATVLSRSHPTPRKRSVIAGQQGENDKVGSRSLPDPETGRARQPALIDFPARTLTVSRAVVEVNAKFHPTGGRFLVKEYLKDGEYHRPGWRRYARTTYGMRAPRGFSRAALTSRPLRSALATLRFLRRRSTCIRCRTRTTPHWMRSQGSASGRWSAGRTVAVPARGDGYLRLPRKLVNGRSAVLPSVPGG
jgi:hypothetical protein